VINIPFLSFFKLERVSWDDFSRAFYQFIGVEKPEEVRREKAFLFWFFFFFFKLNFFVLFRFSQQGNSDEPVSGYVGADFMFDSDAGDADLGSSRGGGSAMDLSSSKGGGEEKKEEKKKRRKERSHSLTLLFFVFFLLRLWKSGPTRKRTGQRGFGYDAFAASFGCD
jgi:hypothetical protein